MNERLGCLGTLATLMAVGGGLLVFYGGELGKPVGGILAAVGLLFVALRVAGARSRRER